MGMALEKLIESCTADHYLRLARSTANRYWTEFVETVYVLERSISPRHFDDLCNNKLQMSQVRFDEKQYIQIACETTINSYFASRFPDSFRYEPKTRANTKKNVDCSYSDAGYKYFIEVKCADFKAKEMITSQDGFKISTFGRLPDYASVLNELTQMLHEGQKTLEAPPKPVLRQKNMDNTLKDFLISAHGKFNECSSDNEVNILVVCCGDAQDMQAWFSYLQGYRGLFTPNPFCKANFFRNVDMVVLTNLYHRHHLFFEKGHLQNIWSFEKACNFVSSNPGRKLNKKAAINHFLATFDHYSYELDQYRIPGPAADQLNDYLRIPYFVKEYLHDRGIVLF